jgi:hypothetical protein
MEEYSEHYTVKKILHRLKKITTPLKRAEKEQMEEYSGALHR